MISNTNIDDWNHKTTTKRTFHFCCDWHLIPNLKRKITPTISFSFPVQLHTIICSQVDEAVAVEVRAPIGSETSHRWIKCLCRDCRRNSEWSESGRMLTSVLSLARPSQRPPRWVWVTAADIYNCSAGNVWADAPVSEGTRCGWFDSSLMDLISDTHHPYTSVSFSLNSFNLCCHRKAGFLHNGQLLYVFVHYITY